MSTQKAFAVASAVAVLFGGSLVAAQGRVVASATGSGHIIINDSLRTFSFTATRDASGNARGQLEVYNRDLAVRVHAKLNCLSISGNTAIMSGTVTETDTPALEGTGVWVKVSDNGEGAGAPPDKITLVYTVNPLFTCDSDAAVPYMNVERGNIQIRP